nr:hypothetical protein [Salmonella enterica]
MSAKGPSVNCWAFSLRSSDTVYPVEHYGHQPAGDWPTLCMT